MYFIDRIRSVDRNLLDLLQNQSFHFNCDKFVLIPLNYLTIIQCQKKLNKSLIVFFNQNKQT